MPASWSGRLVPAERAVDSHWIGDMLFWRNTYNTRRTFLFHKIWHRSWIFFCFNAICNIRMDNKMPHSKTRSTLVPGNAFCSVRVGVQWKEQQNRITLQYEFAFSLYGCVFSQPPWGVAANFKAAGDAAHRSGSPFDLGEIRDAARFVERRVD
jgi:hypothetical protein